jgi:hypothetical protein
MFGAFKGIKVVGAILGFCFSCSSYSVSAQESGHIPSGIFNAVVQIETPPVQGRGDDLAELYDWIDVYFYRTGDDPEGSAFKATRIKLKDSDGHIDKWKVFVHEDRMVDVVAIDVNEEVRKPYMLTSAFSASYMVRFGDIDKQLTGVGDLVFALGYPRGISSLLTNHPIAKVGYLASLPGEEISIPYHCGSDPNGQPRIITVSAYSRSKTRLIVGFDPLRLNSGLVSRQIRERAQNHVLPIGVLNAMRRAKPK